MFVLQMGKVGRGKLSDFLRVVLKLEKVVFMLPVTIRPNK